MYFWCYAILYQESIMPPAETKQHLLSLFKKQPCWMIKPLADEIEYSVPSIRRFLAAIGYFSSFTHNGRWYTLSHIPRFNHNGIWFSDTIGFSRQGSLPQTIVHLVDRSQQGLTAEEIGAKLRSRCHSILVGLYRSGKLQRHKLGRSHIYLSVDPDTCAQQRQLIDQKNRPSAPLPAEMAVLVLAEAIRHPDYSFTLLAEAIRRDRQVSIQAAQVKALFEAHGLKKMLRTGASKPSRR